MRIHPDNEGRRRRKRLPKSLRSPSQPPGGSPTNTAAAVHDPALLAEPALRVCVLASCPFPANHGTPGSIRELAEATAERGHEVHVVTYPIGQPISLAGVHLHRVKPWLKESQIVVGPTIRRPLFDLQMVFKTIEVVLHHKIDLLHAHGYEAALVGRLASLATRVPFLYSAHNTMGDELASFDFFRWKWFARTLAAALDATVPRMATRMIPHSQNLSDFLHERGLGDYTEPVVNFGIELTPPPDEDVCQTRHRLGLGEGPLVLYSGVTDHFQRLELLFEAMVPVIEFNPQARLVMVVTILNEPQLARLKTLAVELGIEDNVLFTQPQDLDGVRDYLHACDVAVVPRPGAPGFPIKLLNYMAAGRASVLFRSSASGLTDGENACLVADDTSAALAERLLELVADDTLRARLGQGGRRFVAAHHDRSISAAKVCRAYVRTLVDAGRWHRVKDRPTVAPPCLPNLSQGDSPGDLLGQDQPQEAARA